MLRVSRAFALENTREKEESVANPVGRPLKYKHFILLLEDDALYTPAAIVTNGQEKGLTVPPPGADRTRLRIRHTLARFAINHAFPHDGDGLLRLPGQAATPAWFGWRWKNALPER